MKKTLRLAVTGGLLAAGVAQTYAQTNVDQWVLSMNVALTGLQQGAAATNGTVAKQSTTAVRIGSKEVLTLLSAQKLPILTKVLQPVVTANLVTATNAGVVTTNTVYVTNLVGAVVDSQPTNTVSATGAKLLLVSGLTNDSSSMVVVRNGKPAVDYDVSRYFRFFPWTGMGGADKVKSGTLNLKNNQLAGTQTSVMDFEFDSSAFDSSTNTAYDVSGYTIAQKSSLVEKGKVVSKSVTKSAEATVAGIGQLVSTNAFVVLKGTVSLSGGKHEVK